MRKQKSLNRKLTTMLLVLGLLAVLITLANVSALKIISNFNSDLTESLATYEEAIKSGDESTIADAKSDVEFAIRHSNIRIEGTYVFDYVLVFVDIVIIVILSIIIRRTVVLPAQKAKTDLDEIISGIESGRGDLTLRVADKTGDEIGQLASGINQFIEVLQNLMIKIQNASSDMNSSVMLVREEAESSNINATNVSATTEQMAASMEEVSASLHELTMGCGEMLDKISTINDKANVSATRLQEVKAKAAERYKDAVNAKEKTISTFENIESGVVASVEASKSVSQITELADNSRETANSIQAISGQVIDAVTDLAGNATEMIRFVDEEVANDYDNFVNIIGKYESDSDEASNSFSEFADMATDSVDTMTKMNDGINNISVTIEESTRGITNVAEEISKLVMAISSISVQAGENKNISDGLSGEVSKFEKM